MIHGSTFTIHLIFKWSGDEGILPTNINPLKSLSSRKCTYIYATGAITDENNACAILTSIPRFATMHTEKKIFSGLYSPGILHTPLVSNVSYLDSISCRALLSSLSGIPPAPLALRFSLSFSSCLTARLASCVFRSFSFRNALDSNSCQSPSRSLSL